MEKLALLVRLEAKPGKEAEVENFLKNGLNLANDEPGTKSWYAIKLGPSTFGIFDTFADEAGRDAHLSGNIAEALMLQSDAFLSSAPVIEKTEIVAVK